MAVITIGRMAEEILKILSGGNIQEATNISLNEIKIAIGQECNLELKTEHINLNFATGETIPNGSVLALYEDIEVVSWNGKSKSTLPIKPIKLPRNMGVFAIYPKYKWNGYYELDKEFIPLQMGQSGLLKSQPMINDLMGQVGYEVFGDQIIYTKDIKSLFADVVVALRLVVMDISQYGDFDPLPILPEMESRIKQNVIKLFSGVGISDKLVDPSVKQQQGLPLKDQQQTV